MPRGQTRRLGGTARRKQILDEAMRLIGKRGYHGFTVQELAARCQLANSGLLYYFGSKEKLLIALLADRDRRDATAIASALGLLRHEEVNRIKLTLDELRQVLHAVVANNAKQPEILRLFNVLASEALDPDHPAHDYFLARETRVTEIFSKLVEPHVADPVSTVRQLLSLMTGLEEQWLRTRSGFDIVAEWDKAAALLLPSAPRAKPSQPRKRTAA